MGKILLLIIGLHLFQDIRVATFSTGKADTGNYESLSFWIKGGKRAYIRYANGKDVEDIDLNYQGLDYSTGKTGFKVVFPDNKNLFYIVPVGDTLLVTDKTKIYHKLFIWENEGSTDSLSNCAICATDAKDAMGIVREYFLK
ncbi:MAG TPA: hypothetical protein VK563_04575 [Puia sp.]|nr:hypothetical protein [Puia sp.]